MNERPAFLMPTNDFLVQPRRFFCKQSYGDFDSCLAKMLKAFARNKRIRVFDRTDNARDTGVDQRLRARWCLPVVIVRLER